MNDLETGTSDLPDEHPCIQVIADGPYEVTGTVEIRRKNITPHGHGYVYTDAGVVEHEGSMRLCRCGRTGTPPWCDGSHLDGFHGYETASHASFSERADVQRGPGLDLMDDGRCAFARFCHREMGDVWTLTDRSDDTLMRSEAIEAASDCPAGRLVAVDRNTGEHLEHDYHPEIDILEDVERGVSGPLFVKGGIEVIGADGTPYEIRNRVALCRCGHSQNKPFCDAMHVSMDWREGGRG